MTKRKPLALGLLTTSPWKYQNFHIGIKVFTDKEDVKTVSIKLDCDVNMIDLLNSEPIYKWYPETKLEKAKQAYSQGVERFKEGRYLDSFHLFQYGYRLTVLGKL